MAALGPATADHPSRPLHLDALGVDLSIHDQGTVVISQPVLRGDGGTVTVFVTVGACSDAVCLPPVIALPVAVSSI